MPRRVKLLFVGGVFLFVVIGALALRPTSPEAVAQVTRIDDFDSVIDRNAERMIEEGCQIFRYDTFGSEDCWGGKLRYKGGFYHDGRFATLSDVVNHYDRHFKLRLTPEQKRELLEILKSI